MIAKTITDSDKIILHTLESYLRQTGVPVSNQRPQEQLIIKQQARDYLYSEIVRRVPRVAAYIMSSNIDEDDRARGLFTSLTRHALDPVFIDILMQYLAQNNNAEENGIVGALLTKIVNKHIDNKQKKELVKPKKGEKDKVSETTTNDAKTDMSDIKHIQEAIYHLIGGLASTICVKVGNLTHPESIAIAACIAMNNSDTITEIIASDLPITAQVFDVVVDPTELIKAALRLDNKTYTKLTTNQSMFIESLKEWVYNKLNSIPTQTCYQILVATYGSISPDVSGYLIQIKDCGTRFSNLLAVAKTIVNNK